jgi:FkbM family methyltransferase
MRSFFQYLSHFKGKLRIAKFWYSKSLGENRPVLIHTKSGLKFSVPNLKENLAFELLVNGCYEAELVKYLIKEVPQGGCFVDVGANIGAISIFLAQKRPDISIFAFEASPRLFIYLEQNVRINKVKNVHAFNYAVFNKDNETLPFYSPEEKFGKGSFSQVFTSEAEMVNTIRLDTFFQEHSIKPTTIKIDVEGYEHVVVEGLSGYFEKYPKKPMIVFEYVDWAEKSSSAPYAGAAQDYLLNKGFLIYTFPEYKVGRKRPLSSLFTHGSTDLIAVPADAENIPV